ncbi:MAG: patatin-like phospholipase family protein [Anaerolineae bacterium]|nr:patatin-like phospholipase family protein [Anaerolineae bacterium]
MHDDLEPIRILILSGGGGRGGFHVGAYDYLHQQDWHPDAVIGTSIGAVNGALIAGGYSPQALAQFWLGEGQGHNAPNLHEVNHVEGLPPRMGAAARIATRAVMRYVLQDRLNVAAPSNSPPPHPGWKALPDERVDEETGKIRKMPLVSLLNRLFGNCTNLLDTGPLRETMRRALHLADEEAWVAQDSPLLLMINATHVRSGRHEIFSNRPMDALDLPRYTFFSTRDEIQHGIRLDHIMASASIPGIYPWTRIKGEAYWDGAIVNNTPLGLILDAANALDPGGMRPLQTVCVLLSPWKEAGTQERLDEMPMNFMDTVNFALDWMLLSSFREQLRLFYLMKEMGDELLKLRGTEEEIARYREMRFLVTAPDPRAVYPGNSYPMWRIIDYDRSLTRKLIAHGVEQTRQAWERGFQ